MQQREILDRIIQEIEPYLREQNIDLVDIRLFYADGRNVLRILADYTSGGIDLNKCAQLNQAISNMLDSKNIIADSYVLEVSSPGLDWPLRAKADFRRVQGKEITMFLKQPQDDTNQFTGIVLDADEQSVFVLVKGNKLQIPFANISKAKRVIR